MNKYLENWRVKTIMIIMILGLLYIYLTYVKLAFGEGEKLSQTPPSVERGSIVDRNGKTLAVQTNLYHFVATPKLIENPRKFAETVAPYIQMNPREIERKILEKREASYIFIKRKITQDQYEELSKVMEERKWTNFTRFDKVPGRIYPENSLASQLIGWMGIEGKGLSGIELTYDSTLSPAIPPEATSTVHGDNIYLTIDAGLQYKLEKIALETKARTQAEDIMIIAANVKNGEILSYISIPSANLNEYGESTSLEKMDRPAVYAYEPGSVFKIFTVASFLDSRVISPDDSFYCDTKYERRTNLGETIRINCLDHHGWLNARAALQFSCNDSIAQMSEKISTDEFLAYIKAFGFGERTGVERPSETKGSVKNQNDRLWSGRSKPTMAIGQELSVSALQMVQAATVIANKGVQMKLTFIHKVCDSEGNLKFIHKPVTGNKVLHPSTADYILSCMETTAQSGTGSKAALRDISIGVKTGTAQMADTVNGGYSETDFLSNCMAIFPVEDPQIILYIVIEKAKGETYAGRIVAPVIAQAADEIIDHLGINREGAASLEHSGISRITESRPIVVNKHVPNFKGRSKRDLMPLLERNDLNIKIHGEGWVVEQIPAAGALITEDMTIELFLE